ncbi:MAG TPA: PCYCGC motif-containing (lipo)protein [Actinomycetota bacterium]|nr:PCYCGC motif-containing (lipo)protein [Actinomycetota bacterium]
MDEPEHQAPTEGTRQGTIAVVTLGIAVLVMVAAGVVGVTIGMDGGSHAAMMSGVPASRTTADAGGFTLDMVPAHLVRHYELARANPDVYSQVPCFCGCEQMLAHRNLEDCFVTPDGAWESHASGCQICIKESRMLMRMMGRGMSAPMMAERVVGEFGGPTIGT